MVEVGEAFDEVETENRKDIIDAYAGLCVWF